jgi:hypothetical protein
MSRLLFGIAALACGISFALAQDPGARGPGAAQAPPRWEVFADCASAYRANWQDRLSDPNRTPAMAGQIADESEQYKIAAIGSYEKERKASADEASRNVSAHVQSNLERFIAMDKAGALEAYIDMCPQRDEPN